MSRRVVNTGAFYTYVARGIGKPPAVGAAYLAVLSYTALTIGLAGAFGYFVDQCSPHGRRRRRVGDARRRSRSCWSAILGYRSADLSAKVLGVLMVLEFAILIIFDVGGARAQGRPRAAGRRARAAQRLLRLDRHRADVRVHQLRRLRVRRALRRGDRQPGAQHPAGDLHRGRQRRRLLLPHHVVHGRRDRRGQDPRDRRGAARPTTSATCCSTRPRRTPAPRSSDIMGVLLCTSVLASMLAVHNASSRYLFALGRERVLPGGLGALPRPAPVAARRQPHRHRGHDRRRSARSRSAGLDPYLTLATSMVGLSTLGVVLLQVLAAVSIVAFFRRRGERDYWRTLVFPAIGAVGLPTAFVLAVDLLPDAGRAPATRSSTALPWLLARRRRRSASSPACGCERRRPAIYGQIAQSDAAGRARGTLPTPPAWTRPLLPDRRRPGRAGHGARAAGRGHPLRLVRAEPTTVGGIWNADTPGSPMYAVRALHLVAVHVRLRRLPDAGRATRTTRPGGRSATTSATSPTPRA